MADWMIRDADGRVRSITEVRLRRKIRRGSLTGEEEVKREGDLAGEWRPLSSLDLYREEGPPDRAAFKARALQRLLAESGGWVFIGVAGFWWSWKVMVLVLSSGLVVELLRYGSRLAASKALPAPSASSPRVETVKAPADPFLTELATAIDELQKAASAAGKAAGLDLPAVKKAAEALHRRRLDLLPLCDSAKRAKLDQEQDQVIAEADKTTDPRLREVLRQQAFALDARLKAMDEAMATAIRLEARERTLLHQVENLRLSHLQSGVEDAAAPSLAEEARKIQAELSSEAEVEETAAKARLQTQRTL